MAKLDFPPSPVLNDIFTQNGRSWIWDGYSWKNYTLLTIENGGTGLTGIGATDAFLSSNSAGTALTYRKFIAQSGILISVEPSQVKFTVTSTGSTQIGTPTDGVYSDGFFNTWTNETYISNAFDDINELLSLIAPAKPGYLTGTSLSAGTVPTYYTANISAGLGNEWYQAGYGTGSSITRYYLTGSHTLNTANSTTRFSAGSLTTSTYGTIRFLRYNSANPSGAGYGTIDLTTNYTVGFTNNNLKLTALSVYENIWTKANAQILTYTQATSGYEGFQITHTENSQATDIYEVWRDLWSNSNPNPSFATSATASTYSQSLKYLSGISYYTTGTGFSVYFSSSVGIYSSCYNSTRIFSVLATGLATSNWSPASAPLYNDIVDRTGSNNYRVALDTSSQSSFGQSLTVSLFKASGSAATSYAAISKYINTYGSLSTTTDERFQDEDYRLVIDTNTAWNSTSVLSNGNLQVRSGTLSYPISADYVAEYGGSFSFTGDQEYQRYFYLTSSSTGTLTFTGISGTGISPYNTGNLNMLMYLEGDLLYYDLGVLQGSNGNNGSTRSLAISAQTAATSNSVSWSIGTKTTGVSGAGNSGRYRLIVIYKNSNPLITRIQSS